LPRALVQFCEGHGIEAATAEGLGALSEVALGYYDVDSKRYERIELPGSWELLQLFATIARWKDGLFAHTHVVLSGSDCMARGGHLFDGRISVTGEIRVWNVDRPISRRMNPEFGLHFLEFDAG
jgi:predicted DNA-binding protein with PD1-like motif